MRYEIVALRTSCGPSPLGMHPKGTCTLNQRDLLHKSMTSRTNFPMRVRKLDDHYTRNWKIRPGACPRCPLCSTDSLTARSTVSPSQIPHLTSSPTWKFKICLLIKHQFQR